MINNILTTFSISNFDQYLNLSLYIYIPIVYTFIITITIFYINYSADIYLVIESYFKFKCINIL